MILEVSKKDEKVLKEISKKAILEAVDAEAGLKAGLVEDTFKHIEDGLGNPSGVFLVYNDSAEHLGYIQVREYWNLSNLFVLPKAHGKGVGAKLLGAALEACRLKSDWGYVRTNSSVNAEGFYRNAGFSSFTPDKPVPDFVVPLIYSF